jgi:hypothetical protein
LMMLGALILLAVVVLLWMFSAPIAQRDPPGGGIPLGRSPGGETLGEAHLRGADLRGAHLERASPHQNFRDICGYLSRPCLDARAPDGAYDIMCSARALLSVSAVAQTMVPSQHLKANLPDTP